MGGGIAYEDPTVPTKFMEYEMIDFGGLDDDTRQFMLDGQGSPEIIYQWIQIAICRANNMGTFGVPPPVLTRAYQDLGLSMIRFHQAQKIVEVPFPLPYVVALQLLLITHWVMTPIVCSGWTDYTAWAVMFALTNTLSLWFFVGVAMEMDSPFKQAMFGIDSKALQRHLNHRLMAQLHTFEGPQPSLKKTFTKDPQPVVMTPQETGLEVGRVRSNSRPPIGNYRRTGSLHGNALTNFCMDGPLEYDDQSDDAASPQDVKLCLPDEKIRRSGPIAISVLHSQLYSPLLAGAAMVAAVQTEGCAAYDAPQRSRSPKSRWKRSSATSPRCFPGSVLQPISSISIRKGESKFERHPLHLKSLLMPQFSVKRCKAPSTGANAQKRYRRPFGKTVERDFRSLDQPEMTQVVDSVRLDIEASDIVHLIAQAMAVLKGVEWRFHSVAEVGDPAPVFVLPGEGEEEPVVAAHSGLPLALFGAYLWTSCAGDLVSAEPTAEGSSQVLIQFTRYWIDIGPKPRPDIGRIDGGFITSRLAAFGAALVTPVLLEFGALKWVLERFGLERVFEVEVPSPEGGDQKVKLQASLELYLTLLARVAFPDSLSKCPIPFLDTEAGLCVYEAEPRGAQLHPGISLVGEATKFQAQLSTAWTSSVAISDKYRQQNLMKAPWQIPMLGPIGDLPDWLHPGGNSAALVARRLKPGEEPALMRRCDTMGIVPTETKQGYLSLALGQLRVHGAAVDMHDAAALLNFRGPRTPEQGEKLLQVLEDVERFVFANVIRPEPASRTEFWHDFVEGREVALERAIVALRQRFKALHNEVSQVITSVPDNSPRQHRSRTPPR
ncbi:cyb5r2 [Symbiodinium sp. CCMP2456]|nr:cyb5r2 [Symbiodinium sp. CCMP2456]